MRSVFHSRCWRGVCPYVSKQDIATHEDLVNRNFTATRAYQLWCTDITEHPTREGKVYCCTMIDAYSRRIVGWAIDSRQTSSLVLSALDMAIAARSPNATIIHSEHGAQFTSWAFSRRITEVGLVGSMCTIGDGYDNAMIESFWSRMQIELLDRKKWKTRTELANAIFDYIEIFHNGQRRHSGLGWLTPTEFEKTNRHLRSVSLLSQPGDIKPNQPTYPSQSFDEHRYYDRTRHRSGAAPPEDCTPRPCWAGVTCDRDWATEQN